MPTGTKDRIFTNDRGMMVLRSLGPSVALLEASGYLTAELVPRFAAEFLVMWPLDRRVHLFVDGTEVKGYETEYRLKMTEFLRVQQPRSAGVHVLTASKLVAMGATLASVALGNTIQIHSRRPVFDGLIQSAIRNG